MKLYYQSDDPKRGIFVFRTGLYSKAALDLIEAIKILCVIGEAINHDLEDAKYGAYLFGEFSKILTDYDNEIVINGFDTEFDMGHHKCHQIVNKEVLLDLVDKLITHELPAEEVSAPNFSKFYFAPKIIKTTVGIWRKNDYFMPEIFIKKKDIFIFRDYLKDLPLETLYKTYSKEEVDAFIGRPSNEFIVELRKDLEERIDKLKESYEKQRTAFENDLIKNHARNFYTRLDKYVEHSKEEENEEIKRMTAETESLILANQ